jgi:hypothetical protein
VRVIPIQYRKAMEETGRVGSAPIATPPVPASPSGRRLPVA